MAARDKAARGDRLDLGRGGAGVSRVLDVGRGARAVEGEARVLVEPEHRAVRRPAAVAVHLVAVHLEDDGLVGGHAQRDFTIPVRVHDDDLARPCGRPGLVDRGIRCAAVLGVGDLLAVCPSDARAQPGGADEQRRQHHGEDRDELAPPPALCGRSAPACRCRHFGLPFSHGPRGLPRRPSSHNQT